MWANNVGAAILYLIATRMAFKTSKNDIVDLNKNSQKLKNYFSDKLSQSSISCHGNILPDSTTWSSH